MKERLDFGQTTTATPKDGALVAAGLQLSPVFAGMQTGMLSDIATRTHQRSVEDGEVLCHQGDVAHTVWLVLDGWVKLTRETLDGSEAVWDVLGQGHVVGVETLLPPYEYTIRAVAVGNGSLLALPHSVLRTLLEKSPDFAIRLLKHMTRQQQDEMLEIEHRTQQTAPQRIGCFLLRLAGTPEDGMVTLHLPFDKGLLAARLGMQPETFSRALAKLKQETGMSMDGAKLTMDVGRMEAYTCGACSGIYPCS